MIADVYNCGPGEYVRVTKMEIELVQRKPKPIAVVQRRSALATSDILPGELGRSQFADVYTGLSTFLTTCDDMFTFRVSVFI